MQHKESVRNAVERQPDGTFRIDQRIYQLNMGPYAITESRGRKYPHPSHPFRLDFQRDRDRVVHSRAFRRLEYKTQVFLNSHGDHFRTRLTHTMEVTALARTIARVLKVNEDLTEAISLAHDLGHTPFGHNGERVLDKLIADIGGFDHNIQSLRVVDYIEKKYPNRDGLNLTWEVRSGLVKRRGKEAALDGEKLPPFPSLEAQIADVSDDLAYYTHDIDDGIEAGLLNDEMLSQEVFWQKAKQLAIRSGGDPEQDYFNTFVVRNLIDMLVKNVVDSTVQRLEQMAPESPEKVGNMPRIIVGFSEDFADYSKSFRTFLFKNLYRHPQVNAVNDQTGRIINNLFDFFMKNPDDMPEGAQKRRNENPLARVVADYIAGMTDRYAQLLHDACCIYKKQ